MVVYDWLNRTGRIFGKNHRVILDKTLSDVAPSVVICGFGRVGQIIAQMLQEQGISYVALDMSVNAVMMGREHGYNVVYGDATNSDVLRDLGLSPRKTRAVVVALDNATRARKTILSVREIAPRVRIFARARNLADSKALLKNGAYAALPETIESSFFMAYGVLAELGISEDKIDNMLTEMRADNYARLSSAPGDNTQEIID